MSMQIVCSDACLSRSAHRSREGACTLLSVATMYLGVPYIYLPTYAFRCFMYSHYAMCEPCIIISSRLMFRRLRTFCVFS